MADARLTRGGRKLEAAFNAFRLGVKPAGARAIDVGASTGGFTRAWLGRGVTGVAAIDVGHDQIDADLRHDKRVQVFERADFKRLALDVAPGPFDLFSVDVSFVAARSMLRGLAFRLRAGAEGIVLIKPQFELRPHELPPNGVPDADARARAAARFREKAGPLGFDVLALVDSPVAGGSGTVELLAHLRFRGRTERLPQVGERRGSKPAAAPRAPSALPARLRWFAVTAPGLETVVADELRVLTDVSDVAVVPGGVDFTGPASTGLHANLWSRVATRMLVRVASVDAREFGPLRRKLAALPWELYLPPDAPLTIAVSTTRCRLYHTGAITEQVLGAIGDRTKRTPVLTPKRSVDQDADAAHARADGQEAPTNKGGDAEGAGDDENAARVQIRGEGNSFLVSIDASGALLHKRGFRVESGPAPLRETLAAGVLALAGWNPETEALLDPMCGAGTFVIEAALRALERPPGETRSFAMERWPAFAREQADLVRGARTRADAPTPAAPPLFGFDHDERIVMLARRNAERARVASRVTFDVVRVVDSRPPFDRPGLVVVNPPYGQRLGNRRGAQDVYRTLGRVLRGPLRAWRAAVLVEHASHQTALGLRARQTFSLVNGGLRVKLLVIDPR